MKFLLLILGLFSLFILFGCSAVAPVSGDDAPKDMPNGVVTKETTKPTPTNPPTDTSPNEVNPPSADPTTPPTNPSVTQPLPSSTPPAGTMSFFLTSVGSGVNGGNYNGLAGADAKCNELATNAGFANKNWKAYLSTSSVNARDRIGNGPWYNYKGELIAQTNNELHENGIPSRLIYDEKGTPVSDANMNSLIKSEHDILTGSKIDGTVAPFPDNPDAPNPTCSDWTASSGDWNNGPYAMVGHADWDTNGAEGVQSWNAAHVSPCSQEGLKSTAGSGRMYCFSVN